MANPALFSIEAEQNVLGSLLASDRGWDDVSHLLAVDDFVIVEHRHIFAGIAKVAESGRAVDAVTVAHELDTMGLLEAVGGMPGIGRLVVAAVSIANLKHYAEIVRDRAQLRRLADALEAGRDDIESADLSLADKVSAITDRLESALTKGLTQDEPKDARGAALQWLDSLNRRCQSGNAITGLRTGFPDLDNLIRGLNKKHLTLIAARPSVGKTTLATNIARAVLHAGHSVYIATMEMSVEDVMTQLCACHTGCSYEALQAADMTDAVTAATGAFSAAVRNWKLTVDDRGSQTLSTIRRGMKRHLRRYGPDALLVVDYAQLVSHKAENETVRIGEISRGLKELSQDLDVPVILVSQLNRESDKRGGDNRPRLVDLRGSGSLEQDASEVLLMHDDASNDPNKTSDHVEVIVAKNRHGRRNVVLRLGKELHLARFVPMAHGSYDDWKTKAVHTAERAEAL